MITVDRCYTRLTLGRKINLYILRKVIKCRHNTGIIGNSPWRECIIPITSIAPINIAAWNYTYVKCVRTIPPGSRQLHYFRNSFVVELKIKYLIHIQWRIRNIPSIILWPWIVPFYFKYPVNLGISWRINRYE